MESPTCKQGTICPHFIRLQYYIAKTDGQKVNLETKKTSILTQFGKLKGDEVCATGTNSQDAGGAPLFEVTELRQAKSAL